MNIELGFGASHKKCAGLVQSIQTAEIDLPTIHDIDDASLWHEHIENIHIVRLSLGSMDKTRDAAT